jgi:hypothetical protein
MYGQTDERTYGWADGGTDGQTDGWTGQQTDGPASGPAGRLQADRHRALPPDLRLHADLVKRAAQEGACCAEAAQPELRLGRHVNFLAGGCQEVLLLAAGNHEGCRKLTAGAEKVQVATDLLQLAPSGAQRAQLLSRARAWDGNSHNSNLEVPLE